MGTQTTLNLLRESHRRRSSRPRALAEAASRLPLTFTREELAVAACRERPDLFSLRGFPGVPDAHVVSYLLCGRRGLVRRGVFVRVPGGRMCLKVNLDEATRAG